MRRNVMEESVTGEISDNSLLISPDLRIPLSELQYRTSRSGGPGGQHVNTSSTRVEVTWSVASSPSLSPEQRTRLLQQLATRLDTEGQLRLVSSGTRSQLRNKEDVTDRLRSTVAAALRSPEKKKAHQAQSSGQGSSAGSQTQAGGYKAAAAGSSRRG